MRKYPDSFSVCQQAQIETVARFWCVSPYDIGDLYGLKKRRIAAENRERADRFNVAHELQKAIAERIAAWLPIK